MMEFYNKSLDYAIPAEKRNDNDFCAIDADTAVGMVEHGFSVYMDGTDRQITYEQLFKTFNYTDLEQHSLFALRSEFEQNAELETLTDDIDRLNDEVLSKDPVNSIESYAKDLKDMGDSFYKWRDGRSEWQNICDSILSGKTEYIHLWLNDISDNFEVGKINDRLKGYEGRYQRVLEDERTQQMQSEKNLAEKQDISYNINADLSATRGESRGYIMEQNTKFEVSSMSKLEGDGPAKAIGTLVVNGEFAIHGVKVVESSKGLFVSMPSEKRDNGEYEDIVFPVTKEARGAIDSAVLGTYEKLAASQDMTIKNEITPPDKAVSTVYAQMHTVDSDKTQTKAAGQITIDKCLVVTGVKMNEGTNAEGQTKTFVAMPAKPNERGSFDDIAHPITADFHNKVDKAVVASANNIGRYEYKGVKYAELGDSPVNSKPLHPKFADKLMAELDKAGIAYQAKCAETVVISVKAEDKQVFEATKKDLTARLNGNTPKPEHERNTGTQSHTH